MLKRRYVKRRTKKKVEGMANLTIRFTVSQWNDLPGEVKGKIGSYCGKIVPKNGIYSVTMRESWWERVFEFMKWINR